jgi:hypothetical protein
MVSIMPGMDIDEPERTETSSGLSAAAELLAGLLFQILHVLQDLVHCPGRQLILIEIGEAGVGTDRESGRHIETDLGHFAEIGALASQQHLVLAVAFLEGIYPFLFHSGFSLSYPVTLK